MPGRKAAAADEPSPETLRSWWMGDQQIHADAGYFAEERREVLSRMIQTDETRYSTKWLSEAIPPRERHPALSWNHHLIVAKLSEPDRRYWLDRAAKEHLSTRQLKDQITKGRPTD